MSAAIIGRRASVLSRASAGAGAVGAARAAGASAARRFGSLSAAGAAAQRAASVALRANASSKAAAAVKAQLQATTVFGAKRVVSAGAGSGQRRGMAVKAIDSDADFLATLKANKDKGIVIDWAAAWCGPCKIIAPAVERLSDEHKDLVFLKVDVDAAQDSARQAGVTSMPTFMFVSGGELVSQFSGADEQQLRAHVATLKSAVAQASSSSTPAAGGPAAGKA